MHKYRGGRSQFGICQILRDKEDREESARGGRERFGMCQIFRDKGNCLYMGMAGALGIPGR